MSSFCSNTRGGGGEDMEAGKQVLSVSLSVEEEASVCWRPHLNDLQNIITYRIRSRNILQLICLPTQSYHLSLCLPNYRLEPPTRQWQSINWKELICTNHLHPVCNGRGGRNGSAKWHGHYTYLCGTRQSRALTMEPGTEQETQK